MRMHDLFLLRISRKTGIPIRKPDTRYHPFPQKRFCALVYHSFIVLARKMTPVLSMLPVPALKKHSRSNPDGTGHTALKVPLNACNRSSF